jgi:hypothetical protein
MRSGGVLRILLIAALAGAGAGACACVSVGCGRLPDVPVDLFVESALPGALTVHVLPGAHVHVDAVAQPREVPVDGHVNFIVERRGLHCTYDYGWYTTSDDDPQNTALLQVRRDGLPVATLTPQELSALPRDEHGCARLRLLR